MVTIKLKKACKFGTEIRFCAKYNIYKLLVENQDILNLLDKARSGEIPDWKYLKD